MKTFVKKLVLAGFVVVLSSVASAQGRRTYTPGTNSYGSSLAYGYNNEILTNFTSGSIITEKPCNNSNYPRTCKSSTAIVLEGAYLHTVTSEIQAGARVIVNNTGDDTLFTLLALGVYNFDTDFKNAFFAQGGLGIYPVLKNDLSAYESKIGFFIGAGKRFPIWDRINYIPSLSMVKKGDLDFGFDIQFLAFSFMF